MLGIIVLSVILVYANTLNNPFIWDDEVLVKNNVYIRNFSYLKQIFTTGLFQGGGEGGHFYRPLMALSYVLDYKLWGLKPFGFHLTSILIHLATALLLFFLVLKISGKRMIGFIAALLFAIHPAHTESVAPIYGRGDVLFGLFTCLTCLLFMLKKKNTWVFIAGLASFLLCLLAKETALMLVLILGLGNYLFQWKKSKHEIIKWFSGYAILSALYIYLRFFVVKITDARIISLTRDASILERTLTFLKSFILYLGLLIAPIRLHTEREFLVSSFRNPFVLSSLILIVLLAVCLKRSFKKDKLVFFGLAWFLIFLAPISNILVPIRPTMAEHWLYVPSIGLLLVAANYLSKIKNKKSLYTVLGIIFILFSTRTIMRNDVWGNGFKFYKHDAQYSPESFLLHNNLGVEYFRNGQQKPAKESFIRSIELHGNYAVAHNNLGVIYENEGRLVDAVKEYQKAIALNQYILAYKNLAQIYVKVGMTDYAIRTYEEALKVFPESVEIKSEINRLKQF